MALYRSPIVIRLTIGYSPISRTPPMALLTADEAMKRYGGPRMVVTDATGNAHHCVHACDYETGLIHAFVEDKPSKAGGLLPNHIYLAPAPLTIRSVEHWA